MLMMVKGKLHPWLGLALAILAGAALLVFLLKDRTEYCGPGYRNGARQRRVRPVAASSRLPNAPQPSSPIDPQALETFKRNLRRALLHRYRFDWMDASSGRDLFLAGHTQEAIAQAEKELRRRVASGDRDAAVRLFGMRSMCADQDFLDMQRDLVENESRPKMQTEALAIKLPPAKRAMAFASIDIDAQAGEIVASCCRGSATPDDRDLEARSGKPRPTVTRRVSLALASIAAWKRDDARSRTLPAVRVAAGRRRRASESRGSCTANGSRQTPQSKDRGKMRFWLEQAYEKVPGAAYDLGMCFKSECDGLPADPDRAQRLIESAARRGDELALMALTHAADGGDAGDKFARYVWADFKTRMAEIGCEPDAIVRNPDRRRENARAQFALPDRTGGSGSSRR